jgi:alkylation response protein AidB-like acyl-CoA dehydrogenase
MDLLPTEEQQQIIDTAANFLAKEFPVQQLINLADSGTGFTRQHLQQIADLGWIGIGLSSEYEGVGYGLSEEALLFVELGRNLLPPSLLGSVLGARVAAIAGDRERLDRILSGDLKIALATARAVKPNRISNTVNGEFLIFEAKGADLVLVANEESAVLLPLTAMQFSEEESCIDGVLDISCCIVADAPALCVVPASDDTIFLRGALLVSAMLLGIAGATLARSVDYAKEREQFGKPIGSFQAIKHYCAEMAIRCESVRALLYHASITLPDNLTTGLFDTDALKALAIDAAQHNANTAVQIHGGMGYTQEMDIHLFVKRAQLLSTLFGSERYHLNNLLAQAVPV